MTIHQISIYLTLDDSDQIRQFLEKNGFAIYKVNRLTQKLEKTTSNSKIVDIAPSKSPNEYYICLYNGSKTLEEMHLNLKKLEEHPAFIYISYISNSTFSFSFLF